MPHCPVNVHYIRVTRTVHVLPYRRVVDGLEESFGSAGTLSTLPVF